MPNQRLHSDQAGPPLGAYSQGIRAGDFSPTADPRPSLCHDCPARARLCPHPPELTMGAAR